MANPPAKPARSTKRRPADPVTYHATLWVDSNFGELSAAAYSVGVARAKREGVAQFVAKLGLSESRKTLIGAITATAVGIVERKRRMSSATDTDRRALLGKAAEVLRLRMGTVGIIAATLAAKLGISFEAELEAGGATPLRWLGQSLAELDGEDGTGTPLPNGSFGTVTMVPGGRGEDAATAALRELDGSDPMSADKTKKKMKENRAGPVSAVLHPGEGKAPKRRATGRPGAIIKAIKGIRRVENEKMVVLTGDQIEYISSELKKKNAGDEWHAHEWNLLLENVRTIMAAMKLRPRPAQVQGEFETGWDVALRRAAGARALSPQHTSEARKRIRAAAAPAFAAALDKAVDAKLLTQFAATRPGGVDAAKLRVAYAETANRAFAAEFVRLVGGQPPAAAEDIALGAIIAVAIAQTTARYPIVQPAAVAPMAVLVHRTLRPRLANLARMAAVIAAAPAAARPTAPAREMAW